METHINIWKPIRINRSNRPILDDNEHNIYIRDNIGLYQGRSKILGRQNGRIYLTNQRIIYFDNEDNTKSIAINLKDISSSEVVDGFLRSSPKVKLYLKSNGGEISTAKLIAWICRICSYNNQISLDFDLDNGELPKCTSCGIQPNVELIKKAIEDYSIESDGSTSSREETPDITRDDQCSKCTFINHPSLKYCELCGSELRSTVSKGLQSKLNQSTISIASNETNLLNIKLENNSETYSSSKPYIKLSFRKGGEQNFQKHVIEAIDEIKWEILKSKGAINQNGTKLDQTKPAKKTSGGGIRGLERIGEQQRQQNENILSSSLDDLEQLMFKFQDILKLSNSFSKLIINSNFRTFSNKTIIPSMNIKRTSTLYHQELSRHISEYLINYELTKSSSIITSQDLFANYNRYLIVTEGFGTEFPSPQDFNKSLELFETLKLPIMLQKYENSGLVVLSSRSGTNDYKTFITQFLREQESTFKYNKLKTQMLGMMDEFFIKEFNFFKGNTISEISDKFNWSYNITIEEIDKCIEAGSVVIDQNISGTFYFINKFNEEENDDDEEVIARINAEILLEQNRIKQELKDQFDFESASNLINLQPNYTFGLDQDENESGIDTPDDYSASESRTALNDLEGLTFN